MDSIISFILGGILTIFVGWLFYKKSNKKISLIPYLDFFSKLFDNVEPEIKKDLKILYKESEIEHLYSVQFTIENNGNKPIRDLIEPLTLTIPKEFEIMDGSISEINPIGRKVELKQNLAENKIIVDFPLLNPKEFFVFKILFKGEITEFLKKKRKQKYPQLDNENGSYEVHYNEKDIIEYFELKITVDDLPPILKIKKESREGNSENENSTSENIFHLIIGVAMGYILWYFTNDSTEYFIFNFTDFFTGFWSWFYKFNYFKLALLTTWLVPIYLTLKGLIVIIVNSSKQIAKSI